MPRPILLINASVVLQGIWRSSPAAFHTFSMHNVNAIKNANMQSSVAEIVHRAAVYYYQVLLFLVSFLPVPGSRFRCSARRNAHTTSWSANGNDKQAAFKINMGPIFKVLPLRPQPQTGTANPPTFTQGCLRIVSCHGPSHIPCPYPCPALRLGDLLQRMRK